MVDIDYNKMFSCPKCGIIGTIYLVKVSSNKIVIKQRCPDHGGRSFTVPLNEKDNYIHLIQDAVFRCYKCGQEAIQSFIKISRPWTLIKCSCPNHGSIITQKIWSSIYKEITSKETATPQLTQPEPSPIQTVLSEENKFCPNCGAELTDSGIFCGECGSKLN